MYYYSYAVIHYVQGSWATFASVLSLGYIAQFLKTGISYKALIMVKFSVSITIIHSVHRLKMK